jgi:valyl-tRNA synthetase
MEQSQDVLDTWFSSALWPFAGLSEEDLKRFYPSSVLITARDIINLWVGRMIFSGVEFMGETPFPDVLIHATILTKDGKRMSKSLGTGIDPLLLIEKYGADATRFGIIWQAMGNQDIHWDEAAVQGGKKFANKLWNIARFVSGKCGELKKPEKVKSDHADDQAILAKLELLKKEAEAGILAYEFGPVLHKIYDFVWHELADVYIESSKNREDESVKLVLSGVLTEVLALLHPFMPFITEELHQKLFPSEAPLISGV